MDGRARSGGEKSGRKVSWGKPRELPGCCHGGIHCTKGRLREEVSPLLE